MIEPLIVGSGVKKGSILVAAGKLGKLGYAFLKLGTSMYCPPNGALNQNQTASETPFMNDMKVRI